MNSHNIQIGKSWRWQTTSLCNGFIAVALLQWFCRHSFLAKASFQLIFCNGFVVKAKICYSGLVAKTSLQWLHFSGLVAKASLRWCRCSGFIANSLLQWLHCQSFVTMASLQKLGWDGFVAMASPYWLRYNAFIAMTSLQWLCSNDLIVMASIVFVSPVRLCLQTKLSSLLIDPSSRTSKSMEIQH